MAEIINLEKQIKRHLTARCHDFFVMTHPGFESICCDEIRGMGPEIDIGETVKGGVVFNGRMSALFQANLHLRTAGRVLMRISEFKASNFHQLAHNTGAVPWAWYLPWGTLPRFRITARRSRLFHTQAVAQHMAGAVEGYWQRMGALPTYDPDQNVWVRIEDDRMTLSLDSSGEHLYRRGLKTHPGRAPIRETLAAAILIAAGYRTDRPLIDPMCGAGTFALEAALMTKHVPPGNYRDFAFMHWPSFRPRQWHHLKSRAADAIITWGRPLIMASDIDDQACRALTQCVQHNDLQDAVDVACRDFFSLEPMQIIGEQQPGLVVLNPPYGRRLKPTAGIDAFYARIGAVLSRFYKGWRAAVLLPSPDLAGKLPPGLSAKSVTHGGQSLKLFMGTIG